MNENDKYPIKNKDSQKVLDGDSSLQKNNEITMIKNDKQPIKNKETLQNLKDDPYSNKNTSELNKMESSNNSNAKNINKVIGKINSEKKVKQSQKDKPIVIFKKIIKNKIFIITISSLLFGASAIAIGTIIPMLVIDTNVSLSVNYAEIIKNYNLKSLTEKISNYNKMVESNNKTILKYFFDDPMDANKKTGLYNWAFSSLDINASITLDKNFITFLENIWSNNISSIDTIVSVNNTTFNNFLSIFNANNATNTQSNDLNRYWSMNAKVGASSFGIKTINMYSTFNEYIEDINIDSDFSINITFKANILNQNLPFKIIDTSDVASTLKYKSTIVINDITLFPGATQYIKKNMLGIMN